MDGDVVARVDPTCHAYLAKARVQKFLWQFKVFPSPLGQVAKHEVQQIVVVVAAGQQQE